MLPAKAAQVLAKIVPIVAPAAPALVHQLAHQHAFHHKTAAARADITVTTHYRNVCSVNHPV
jgi:hypothetical protein